MSKIFFPYIYHGSIAHNYYINLGYRLGRNEPIQNFSTIFSTGIRDLYDKEFDKAYMNLLDQLLIYETCMIPVEDALYLIVKLGYEDAMKIIQSNGIKLYDALSNRIGIYYGPNNIISIFSETQPEDSKSISKRIDDALHAFNESKTFSEDLKDSIIKLFQDAYFINDIKHLFKLTEKDFSKDLEKEKIKQILEFSSKETSFNLSEQQMKLNRLLHFHYYKRISEMLKCQYMYVPLELEGLYNFYASEVSFYKNNLESIFSKIIKLERIPDIPKLLSDGILSIDDLLEIRDSKEAKKFRKWIDKLSKENIAEEDSEIFTKLYHEACLSNNKFKKTYNSKSGSALRTIGLLSIGVINQAIATGITFIDYMIDNNLNNYNPSNFTRDKLLKRIQQKNK
jgi:hypothetical protein